MWYVESTLRVVVWWERQEQVLPHGATWVMLRRSAPLFHCIACRWTLHCTAWACVFGVFLGRAGLFAGAALWSHESVVFVVVEDPPPTPEPHPDPRPLSPWHDLITWWVTVSLGAARSLRWRSVIVVRKKKCLLFACLAGQMHPSDVFFLRFIHAKSCSGQRRRKVVKPSHCEVFNSSLSLPKQIAGKFVCGGGGQQSVVGVVSTSSAPSQSTALICVSKTECTSD